MLTGPVRISLPLAVAAAWGLAPWVGDGGVLVWIAAAGWAILARRSLGGALGVAAIGSALHLAWMPGAWRDGVGEGGLLAYAVLVAVQALPPALAVIATHRAAPRLGWPLAAFIAWMGAQFLATRLTWLPALHAVLLADTGIWLWPAALGGPTLLTGLVAAWGFLVTERPRLGLGILAAGLAVGLALPTAQLESRWMEIGIIQPDISALDARTPSRADAIADRIRSQLSKVSEADFAVAPEGVWPVDPGSAPGARRTTFLETLQAPIPVLIGATVGRNEPHRNSVLAVEQDRVGLVHKTVLVPLWERKLGGFGEDRYRPGRGIPVLPIAGTRVGVLICYEDLFPQQVRLAARSELLLLATNDSWNGPGAGSRAHLAAARLAAVSAGLWVVRPTLNGRSAVFDRWGSTVWQAPWVEGPMASTTGHQDVVRVGIGSAFRPGLWLEPIFAGLGGLFLAFGLWRSRPKTPS